MSENGMGLLFFFFKQKPVQTLGITLDLVTAIS